MKAVAGVVAGVALASVAAATPLPPGSVYARGEHSTNAALALRLSAIGQGYRGWSAFWVHDLKRGATAGWNSDALFPAASTVKLGVLAAALRRFGPYPERTSAWKDLRAIARTSDNAATNRLVARVGGLRAVQDALQRLGMTASTYPGPYRVESSSGDAPRPPPQPHWRVTTAHDLARGLYTFHAAANGNRWLQHRSGLTEHEARLGIDLLLASDGRGDNVGLLRPYLRGAVLAEKNGWLSDIRATAAIVYLPHEPTIVVVLAYRPGISLREAQALGREVALLVRRAPQP